MSAGVLKQYGGEPFDGSERSAVDHDRALLAAVRVGIFKLEPLRQVVVHLDGAKLPLPSYGVLDHEIKLRAVESGLAIFNDGFQPLLLCGLDDGVLGLLPVLVASDVLGLVVRIPEGNLGRVLVELEDPEHIEDQVDDLLELALELVWGHEHVGVILSEGTNPRESVEFSALLVTVNSSELGQSQRKILVRPWRRTEYLTVVRAVHRFEHIFLTLLRGVDRLEGVLAVLGVVARGHVQVLASDVRGDNRQVAIFILLLAEELLKLESHHGASRQPERQSETHA